jgi:hypothetical protein
MANNRMYLVDPVSGSKLHLASYYPSSGWYTCHSDLALDLDKFFLEAGRANPENRHTLFGFNGWELEFDVTEVR